MKANKKIIISILLVLTIFSIVGSVNASDSSNETMTINDVNNEDINLDDSQSQLSKSLVTKQTTSSLDSDEKERKVEDNKLREDNTGKIYVAPNEDKKYGDGSEAKPFASIERAVKNATIDGTTIYIKNGEYKDSVDFTDNKISLRLIGEERGKVIIRPTSSYVKHIFQTCTTGGTNLVLENLSFTGLDYSNTDSAPLVITGNNNVNLTNCSFKNINAKYGAMKIDSSKEVNINDCLIENVKVSDGLGSVIYISGSGHYNLNRVVIDDVHMDEVFYDDNYMTAVIYISNSNAQVVMNNTKITNAYRLMDSLIQNRGNTIITNTIIANNTVNISGTHGHKLIYNNNNGVLNISNSLIIDNTLEANDGALFEESSKAKTLNIEYCAIYNNIDTKLFEGLNDKVTIDNNYWGNNTKPSELNSAIKTWLVKGDYGYKISDGETLSDLPSNIILIFNEEENVETNIVKPETFNQYFDNFGNLKDLGFDELIFTGEFKDLKLIINKAINLTGNNTLFNNTVINILANNVTIRNINFVADKIFEDKNSVIYCEGENALIENNTIQYNAPNSADSYVIYMDSADKSRLLSNKINYTGSLGENIKTMAVYSITTSDLIIKNNTIHASIPALDQYDNNLYVKILTDGLFLEECGNILVEANNIYVNYTQAKGTWDTISALKIIGIPGHSANITKNNIEVNGHKYAYGISVNGFDNIEISGNNVLTNALLNQSNALELNGNSSFNIDGNNLSSFAKNVVYPINLSNLGLRTSANILNNNIKGEANAVYSVYTQGHDSLVLNNNIDVKGNYTIGIVAHDTNLIIRDNVINSNGNNIGTILSPHGSVPSETTAITVSKSDIEISANRFTSSGVYTIDAISCNGSVRDNYLSANGLKGDKTISQSDSKLFIDNDKSSGVVDSDSNVNTTINHGKSTSTSTDNSMPKQVIVAKNLKVKKSSKTLKIKVSLKKVNNKVLKNKKVVLKFRNKKYVAKTNKKGVVVFKISKKVLRKLKFGKTYKYTVSYGKYKLTKKISVKK